MDEKKNKVADCADKCLLNKVTVSAWQGRFGSPKQIFFFFFLSSPIWNFAYVHFLSFFDCSWFWFEWQKKIKSFSIFFSTFSSASIKGFGINVFPRGDFNLNLGRFLFNFFLFLHLFPHIRFYFPICAWLSTFFSYSFKNVRQMFSF